MRKAKLVLVLSVVLCLQLNSLSKKELQKHCEQAEKVGLFHMQQLPAWSARADYVIL